MQSDDFDKKIKEAAEHHHPAYEEKAWEQMEKLLDKHLPVEKDDRRRIIFLLLFLLLGGVGVYLGISKPWQQKKITTTGTVVTPANGKNDVSSTESNTKEKTGEPTDKTALPEAGTTGPAEKNAIEENRSVEKKEASVNKTSVKSDSKIQADKQKIAKELTASTYGTRKINSKSGSQSDAIGTTGAGGKQKTLNKSNVSAPGKSVTAEVPTVSPNADNNNTANKKAEDITTSTSAKPVNDDNTVKQTNKPVVVNSDSVSKPKAADIAKADAVEKKENAVKKQNSKPGKQRKSSFALTFTAGPDLSTVGLSDAGKVKLTYGAGVSYRLNRFTLRSGFYVAKKVYTAEPDDYHPPKHYWTYYVDLTKVDADCKVYEIPVTISYNFSESRTHNWFASAGLSSYLMKKEKYGYYYKDPTTQMPEYKDWTLKNGENHIFSILNLSAGYERKLNKTLSLIAEPYLKIPMDGIGFGSIKLNSMGVLFTLSVRPFATKK